MAKSITTLRDEQHELSRRALIKWSVAAGAALGVSRSKIFQILNDTAGSGVAQAAANRTSARWVHIICGNGSNAWNTQLFPFPDIAKSGNAALSYNFMGQVSDIAGTAVNGSTALVKGPTTPFADVAAQKQMTCFVCGTNETHTKKPVSTGTLGGTSIFQLMANVQLGQPSTVPLVSTGGATTGAPGEANVPNAAGFAGLFGATAAKAGGILAASGNGTAYATAYKALIQLQRAANRPTTKTSYLTGSKVAENLAINLSDKLAVTPADLARYGIDGNTRGAVAAIGQNLIVTAKAFALGLTNAVITEGSGDDCHGAFDSGDVNTIPAQMAKYYDQFYKDCAAATDTDGNSVADTLVMSWTGDTFKTPVSRPGWGDGTPNNCNVLYVASFGRLMPGWRGGVTTANRAVGFGADGKPNTTYVAADTAKIALSSLAYAIAEKDERAANVTGISGIFGNVKG